MSSFRQDLKMPLGEKILNSILVFLAASALVVLAVFVAK